MCISSDLQTIYKSNNFVIITVYALMTEVHGYMPGITRHPQCKACGPTLETPSLPSRRAVTIWFAD
jgi:hypothetical protein